MPLRAEARPAPAKPNNVCPVNLSLVPNHAAMSTTRKMSGPSGPTLAPESIEKKDVSNAPGNVVKSGLKFGSVRTSSMVPWITFGARMYFPTSPTSSEKNRTRTGIIQRLAVTKLFCQKALLSKPNTSSQTSAKRAEIKATKTICRILGVRSSAETRTTGASWCSTG